VSGIEDFDLLCMQQGRERECGLNSIHFVEDVRTLRRRQPLVRNLNYCVFYFRGWAGAKDNVQKEEDDVAVVETCKEICEVEIFWD